MCFITLFLTAFSQNSSKRQSTQTELRKTYTFASSVDEKNSEKMPMHVSTHSNQQSSEWDFLWGESTRTPLSLLSSKGSTHRDFLLSLAWVQANLSTRQGPFKALKESLFSFESCNERNSRCERPFAILGVDTDCSRASKRTDKLGCNHKNKNITYSSKRI